MAVLVTIVLDLGLALTLLISLQIAAGWGELGGIRPGGDKSGLGGFTMLLIFFLFRWIALAIGLVVTASEGEWWQLLAAHGVLGWISVTLFQRGVTKVQRDGTVGNLVGILGSTLLPAPAWLLALQRTNAEWLGGSAQAVLAAGVVLAHFACYTTRRSSMLAPRS